MSIAVQLFQAMMAGTPVYTVGNDAASVVGVEPTVQGWVEFTLQRQDGYTWTVEAKKEKHPSDVDSRKVQG